jgi:hypothetical protein
MWIFWYTPKFSVFTVILFLIFYLSNVKIPKKGKHFALILLLKQKTISGIAMQLSELRLEWKGLTNPPISAKETIAFVKKILYELFPLQRPKIHELIELTAFKILNTRTRINHTGQRIYFPLE